MACLFPRIYRFINSNGPVLQRFIKELEASYFKWNFCYSKSFSVQKYEADKLGKFFIENENNFSHTILESIPAYSNSIVRVLDLDLLVTEKVEESEEDLLNTNWLNVSLDEVCIIFKKISRYAVLSNSPLCNEKYTFMVTGLKGRIKEMTDEQLSLVLSCLKLWPLSDSVRAKNFYELWKEIDNACIARRTSWQVNKLLFFIDLFYLSRLIRMSDFVFLSITHLGKKPNRLTSNQLVQFLFYLNALRTAHKGIKMYEVEYRLEEVVDELETKELAIALIGFFKTQTRIYSMNLMAYLIRRCINEINTIPEISLTSFLKVIRMSVPVTLWYMSNELLDSVETQVDRLSIQGLVHVALLSTKPKNPHIGIMNKISQRLLEEIEGVRLKDMEKIIYTLTLLNIVPNTSKNIYEEVEKEIQKPERQEEANLFPKCMIALLHYLTLRSVFHVDLIAQVLDNNYLKQVYGKTNYGIGREILSIDTCVELECPKYKGPRLSADVRNYLSKRYSSFRPRSEKLSSHDQLVIEIESVAEEVLGQEYFVSKYIIPNQPRADFVFALENGTPLPIPKSYEEIEDFTGPIRAPQRGDWYCLVAGSKNIFTLNSVNPTGETACKIRHLTILGYKPIFITWKDWPTSGKEERISFLRDMIFNYKNGSVNY